MTETGYSILSCGFVVVRQTPDGWRTLMLRAYRHWDFPKGVSEAGELPLVTAHREVAEETAITALHLDWGERFMDSGPYDRGKLSRYFLGRTEQQEIVMGMVLELGHPEHHEYRWVDFDTAHDLATARVREVVRWARQVIGA